MSVVTIEEVSRRLDQLVDDSQTGGEFVLTRANRPVAKIVALPTDRPRPRRGSGKDFIEWIVPDFDETPEGFEGYMP